MRRSLLLGLLALGLVGLRAGASPPETLRRTRAGPLVVTDHGTVARIQDGFGRQDHDALLAAANATAKERPPNAWRVLLAIVRSVDVEWIDAAKKRHRTKATIGEKELARCRRWFDQAAELAFALTGGALRFETDVREVARVTRFDPMGEGVYWLSPATALQGVEVPQDRYDSIVVYYRPGDVPIGLLGGTYGRDCGIAGAGVSSLQIPEDHFAKDLAPFPVPAVATLHEWLHQMSWCARERMGYKHTPDCHAAEENGFSIQDGGYGEWVAWYRALMLGLMTEGFWRNASMHGELAPRAVNADLKRGPFFTWDKVKDDWQRDLPTLDEAFLRERTGLANLKLELRQRRPNDSTWLVITGIDGKDVLSPVADGDAGNVALDNVLSLVRAWPEPVLASAEASYAAQKLESLAVVRPAKGPRRDFVFVRADVARAVLPLLVTKGPRATERLLGFVSLPDPSEKHPTVFFVAEVDLGETLPKDELAALGLR